MELIPEEELSTATKAVLQMFRLNRGPELTDEDRRCLGAALRQFAWESRCELKYLGPGGGWMYERMHDMADLIGGEESEEETRIRRQMIPDWKIVEDRSERSEEAP